MRVQEREWAVNLSQRERTELHAGAFLDPTGDDGTDLAVRRLLPDHRFVVEARRRDGTKMRLSSRSGRWERGDGPGQPITAHTFSTLKSAMNALGRGERTEHGGPPMEASAAA